MLLTEAAARLLPGAWWLFALARLGILAGACALLVCRRAPSADGLTGAMDYSLYARHLKEGFPGGEICVFFLDVDELKSVNDTSGHEAGDRLIRRLADSFAPVMGEGDVLYRVGGDEFVLVVQNLRPESVPSFLVRWHEELRRLNTGDGPELKVSCGWAAGTGSEFSALVRRADNNMYRTKNDKKS